MEITYDLIKPIIINQEAKGSLMLCQFGTSDADEIINSSARIKKIDNTTEAADKAKQGTMRQLKKTIAGLMRNIFGGITGRTASDTLNQTVNYGVKSIAYTKSEKQAAVVEAFQNVASKFCFDEKNNKWVLVRMLSSFEKKCYESPIEKKYDKEILVRILVELANADNNITKEERDFLESFITEDLGTIDELLDKEAVSKAEFDKISPSVRETMYMLAWTVALIDKELALVEKVKLDEYRRMLSLSDTEANEVVKLAQYYIIERVIAFKSLVKEDLYHLADTIELDREEAEQCVIQYKKRMEGQ